MSSRLISHTKIRRRRFQEARSKSKVGIVSTPLVDAFFLPCFAYDLITRRRIHPAYFVALTLVLDQVAQVKVVPWTPWINFSLAMQRLVT